MEWVRASRCESNACVEVMEQYGAVIVRSSKRPEELLVVDSDEWATFIAAVKKGEFDL